MSGGINISQPNFNPFLGCKHSGHHIDPTAGIFGVLEERFRKLIRENPIPARVNTACAHRRSAQCNINCPKAVSAIQSGGSVSYRVIGARM